MIIYFDQIFVNNLCKCYLGDQLCCAVRGIEAYRANYSAVFEQCGQYITQGTIQSHVCEVVPNDKLKLVQAQLACGVGMLVTCGIYVVLYIFACFGICFGHD